MCHNHHLSSHINHIFTNINQFENVVSYTDIDYVFCGGFANIQCSDGYECIDDPRDSCDPNCNGADCGGICVKVYDDGNGNGADCGGILGLQCPNGFQCFDVDTDSCNPGCGGADCIGFCADPLIQP